MEFDKKTVLAFLLIGLILVIVNTDLYQKLVFGDRPQVIEHVKPDSTGISETKFERVRRSDNEDIQPELETEKPTDEFVEEQEEVDAREIIVDTPLYYGVFSTRGGTVVEWKIKKYTDDLGEPVTLVKEGE